MTETIPGSTYESKKLQTQILLVVLEKAWRRLLEKDDLITGIRRARRLLRATQSTIVRRLTEADTGREGDYDCRMEIGGGFLRLYFATEIALPGSKMERRYLTAEQVDGDWETPSELKRQFIVNLSRFMLGVVARLQKELGLRTDATATMPPVSNPSEELDGLVFLIDRFAHVELEVDEVLAIRHHLARQVRAEVSQYIQRPHYRDHLLHAIDVFLLGHLLLNTQVAWVGDDRKPLAAQLVNILIEKDTAPTPAMKESDWRRNWAVASLLHDIGYQLGAGDKALHDHDALRRYFTLPEEEEIIAGVARKRDTHFRVTKPEEYLQQIAGDLRGRGLKESFPEDWKVETLCDHGVLSALRVGQVLYVSKVSSVSVHREAPSSDRYDHAIHAISRHNLVDEPLAFQMHPLTCLLRLCDELQEWGRRRVNFEKTVKGLYLDLLEGGDSNFPAYEMLDSIKVNLSLTPHSGDSALAISSLNVGGGPWFKFDLRYRDPISAHFDPMMTLLYKAFSLQHLDLAVPSQSQSHRHLSFTLVFRFPVPADYGELTEYDIFGRFVEKKPCFPLLRRFNARYPEPGLFRMDSEEGSRADAFAILLKDVAASPNRRGWLRMNPAPFFDEYIDFKKEILSK